MISKDVPESNETFREILWRNCDGPKSLKEALRDRAQKLGFPEPFIKFMEDNFILNDVWLGGVEVYGEFSLISVLQSEDCGLAFLKLGYLQFAGCGNGDFAVVNIKDKYGGGFGEVGYICHEECAPFNGFANLSENLRMVAPSLQEFALGHENETMANDYFHS